MDRYLMQYNGKKKEPFIITRNNLNERYTVQKGTVVSMLRRDAEWFMTNDPTMFAFKGYDSVTYPDTGVETTLITEGRALLFGPGIEGDKIPTPKVNIITDMDNEGPLPGETGIPTENIDVSTENITPGRSMAELMSMKLPELKELAKKLDIVVDEELSPQKQRGELIKLLKDKQVPAVEG
jgi:hypothetical protein